MFNSIPSAVPLIFITRPSDNRHENSLFYFSDITLQSYRGLWDPHRHSYLRFRLFWIRCRFIKFLIKYFWRVCNWKGMGRGRWPPITFQRFPIFPESFSSLNPAALKILQILLFHKLDALDKLDKPQHSPRRYLNARSLLRCTHKQIFLLFLIINPENKSNMQIA